MYTLEDIRTFRGMETFSFSDMTVKQVSDICGGGWEEDFQTPGYYRVLIGSRGLLEEIEFVGSTFPGVPTPTDIFLNGDWDDPEMIDEYYTVENSIEFPGSLLFAYNEEEYELFFKVV